MWKKLILLFESISFYLSNIIVLKFIFDAYKKESISDLITIGVAILGIIGALSALSYSGSTSKKDEITSKIFLMSGDRFFHSFINIVFGFLFAGVIISIKKYGIWGMDNKYLLSTVITILLIFVTISFIRAGRSFALGFHMVRKILNEKFPLKDEVLFDDIGLETDDNEKK